MNSRVFVLGLSLALGLLAAAPAQAQACPWCVGQGQTLTGETQQALLVVYGKLTNGQYEKATVDLVIEDVVKDNKIREDRKVLPLQRFIPPASDNQFRYLIFCDTVRGKVDPYRGVAVRHDSDLIKYLRGALELTKKGAKVPERLRYFFDF